MVPRTNAPCKKGAFFCLRCSIMKKDLLDCLKRNLKELSIHELMKKCNLSYESIEFVIDALYQLELEGKVIGNKNGFYMAIPQDYYLKFGEVKISSKKNYYISLNHGMIILLSEYKNIKAGDMVYVDTIRSQVNKKQYIGKVIRKVERWNYNPKQILCGATLQKDFDKNLYYIKFNNQRIPIFLNNLNGAFVGDDITVQITLNDNNSYGKVINIVKRLHSEHVFEYKKTCSSIYSWSPVDQPGVYFDIVVRPTEAFQEGDTIVAKVGENNTAKYVKRIVFQNDIDRMIQSLSYNYDFPLSFSNKAKKELERLPNSVTERDLQDRVDLRDLDTVTIDSNRAKDLDDAVSIQRKENHWILYVHIADVSHYVKMGTKLFEEAGHRGTSVYLVDYVIPMLPKRLSNDLCSLNPNEDKLTLTCEMVINDGGGVNDYKIYRSIIRSNKRMTYNAVNQFYDGNLNEEYVPYAKMLYDMNLLSSILQKHKLERGYIGFETSELEFDMNSLGNVEDINYREKGQAQLMIENFMLIANETIASYAYYLQVPFAFRNHESLGIEQLGKMKSNLKKLSHRIEKIRNLSNPKVMQKLLLSLFEGRSKEEIVYLSNMMLTCMNRAYYSHINIGHYGLALEQYATFTSPIRRFPDLMNHIILNEIIDGNIDQLETYRALYEEMCIHATERQIAAEQYEKEIDAYVLNHYLDTYNNAELIGKIIFIIDNVVGIELHGKFHSTVTVAKKHIDKYKIGDLIKIMINQVDKDSNEIKISIIDEDNKIYKKERTL